MVYNSVISSFLIYPRPKLDSCLFNRSAHSAKQPIVLSSNDYLSIGTYKPRSS